MKFSTRAKKIIKSSKNAGITSAYLYAVANGFDTYYFPEEFCVSIPKTHITVETVDEDFLKEWVAQWPSPSQIRKDGGHLSYSISGNLPECRKRMARFLKQWDEFVDSESNPYDLIAAATEKYLERQRDNGWEFTKKNHKFILDNDGSVLSQMIADLGEPVNNSNFYL